MYITGDGKYIFITAPTDATIVKTTVRENARKQWSDVRSGHAKKHLALYGAIVGLGIGVWLIASLFLTETSFWQALVLLPIFIAAPLGPCITESLIIYNSSREFKQAKDLYDQPDQFLDLTPCYHTLSRVIEMACGDVLDNFYPSDMKVFPGYLLHWPTAQQVLTNLLPRLAPLEQAYAEHREYASASVIDKFEDLLINTASELVGDILKFEAARTRQVEARKQKELAAIEDLEDKQQRADAALRALMA